MRKVVVLVLAASALAACSGDDGPTGAIRGYRFTATTTTGGSGRAGFETRTDGVVDLVTGAARLMITTVFPSMSSPAGSQLSGGFGLGGIGSAFGLGAPPGSQDREYTQDVVFTRSKAYMRIDREIMGSVQVPAGKEWFELPSAAAAGSFGAMTSPTFGPGDQPEDFFDSFKDIARGLREVGPADVGGVATVRYDARVRPADALQPYRRQIDKTQYKLALRQFRSMGQWRMSVWVADDGLVYRTTAMVGSGAASYTVVTDLYDYGDVRVDVPAPGLVTPYSSINSGSSSYGSFSCTASTSGQSVGTSTVNGVTTTTTC